MMGTAASTGGAPSTGGSPQSTGSMQSTGSGQSSGSIGSMGSTIAAMMGWGDDWRDRLAAGSTDAEKEKAQLQRYESPEQIWRKARELERKMSSGELRAQLKKDATPEEVAAYRTANGIPDKPEAYKINMPAGKEAPKEDDAFLKAFQANAHAANYTQEQFDKAVASFYAEVDRQQTEVTESERKLAEQTEDKLRQEWGADYRPNKAMAEALLARAPAGFRDRFMNGYLADHTPIKASAEAWKWLVQMEREINPAATVVPGAGGNVTETIEAELATIKKHMANHGQAPYYKGPESEKMQARYRELLTAQEKMKKKAG